MTEQDPRQPRPTHTYASDAQDVTVNDESGDESDEQAPAEEQETTKGRQSSFLREVAETIILALLIFFLVRAVVLNFQVDGQSMAPSMTNNEMLLVNRNAYFNFDRAAAFGWLPGVDSNEGDIVYLFGEPERGDIIVFDPPLEDPQPYIKRVIGVAGDVVELRDDGVFVNGTELDEPYLEGRPTPCGPAYAVCGPIEVGENEVFVLGDNRGNSEDSRYWGMVDVDDIIGRALFSYWPRDEFGGIPHHDYPELED